MHSYTINSTIKWSRWVRMICAMLTIILFVPAAVFSQFANPAPVALSTAGTYGALAFSGIIGTSVVHGDVGTISSTIGAGITVVNGTNWGTAGGHNLGAQTDLSNALDDANGRANDLIIPADNLGGLVLGRGVYVGVALDLGANAILTLTGSSTDVFIIKANSSLTINANSTVLLVGGVDWKNIFWYVGSSAHIFDGTTFSGIVLAAVSVSLEANAVVQTQLLANGGAVTINSDILPVELVSFTAALNDNAVKLNWRTATEVNNYGFVIERSQKSSASDGRSQNENTWENVGFIKGSGNSNSIRNYEFTDKNLTEGKPCLPAGRYLYRLKQIDNDGAFKYSDVVAVEMAALKQFALNQNYPNPFNPLTNIQYSIPAAGIVTLTVYDILGKEISTLVNEEKQPGTYQVKFNDSKLSSGIYIYRLQFGNLVINKIMSMIK